MLLFWGIYKYISLNKGKNRKSKEQKKNVTSDELWKEIAIEGIIKIKKGVRKKGCE